MEPERRRLYTEYFQRGEPDQDPEPNNLQRKHVLGRLKKGIGPLSPTRPSLLMLTSRSTATNYCCDGNTLGAVKMKGKSESEEWRCILAEMKSWRTQPGTELRKEVCNCTMPVELRIASWCYTLQACRGGKRGD